MPQTENTENSTAETINDSKQQKEQKQSKEKEQQHDAAIRLYSCRKNASIIPSVFEKAFSEECKKLDFVNDSEFVLTLNDDTFLKIRIITNKQETMVQAYGMANFFSKAPVKNQVLKENILQQMKLFNCIISIQFILNSDEKRTMAAKIFRSPRPFDEKALIASFFVVYLGSSKPYELKEAEGYGIVWRTDKGA